MEDGEWVSGYHDEIPDLNPFERWLLSRFRELDRSRPEGMAGTPALLISEMRAHWEGLELTAVYPFSEHLYWMQMIDNETRFLRQEAAKKTSQNRTKHDNLSKAKSCGGDFRLRRELALPHHALPDRVVPYRAPPRRGAPSQ